MITGANGGLGRHVTGACLRAGYRVAGVAPGIASSDFDSPDFVAIPAMITSSKEAADVVAAARTRWGQLDALVHLAGGFEGGHPFSAADDAELTRMWQVNLMSFAYTARAVLPVLQEQRSGSLVAIGSRAVLHPQNGLSAYAASKAALVSLVQTIAQETREFGITANVVLPGTMDTPANRAAMPASDPAKWVQPSQVAAMIVHLLSEQATQVSGTVIPILGSEG